ncbi:MAG: AI-2E family transporter, partial [Candidatus Magasanikbacteria bacterium]|nr:AI-2E family transporter [Candidatus Magasanikbacteria bacterium]
MAAKVDFGKMRSAFFFLLIGILGIAILYIIRPFLYPIFWAAVVAVLFFPFFTWTNRHIKIPSVSAIITILTVITIIFLPLILVSVLLVQESASLIEKISQGNFLGAVENFTLQIEGSRFAPLLENIRTEWTQYASQAAQAMSSFIFTNIKAITQNSIQFVFMSFIMLYTLFYFLKDGKRMLLRFMHLSPLGDEYEEILATRFTSTARATLKGTLIIGGIQGLLGGLLFLFTGIEGAFVWGVIMTILSIIPAVGSFLVWFPAGLIMIAMGNVGAGVTILLVGAIVI